MSLERELSKRSGNNCELCSASGDLVSYTVKPKDGKKLEDNIHICNTCFAQLSSGDLDSNHWRCLNDSMWSEVDAVKVVAFRTLHQLKAEGWSGDLLEMMYMDEDVEAWAKDGLPAEDAVVHKDANGAILSAGDSVVLIKDLKVKGGNFTAKRGTAVRNITLDHDNEKYIEGKVEGQRIVIITDYVKK